MANRGPTFFAKTLSRYFFEYLPSERGLSQETIQSYRDAMSLLLDFCERERKIRRDKLEVSDFNRELIDAFFRWLEQEKSRYRQCDIDAPLFCNRSKASLTRGGVYYIIQKYVSLAQKEKPDLFPVRVHPHVFRHSRAMHWLEAGVDLQYIKDLLGHSDIKTTEVYARLNIKMKQKLLEQVHPQQLSDQQLSWTDDENLMQWLTQLYIPTK